jgi:hypothetical protein
MPQKSPERYAIGVSDSRSDFFQALVSGLQQMHRALHTQFLEIRHGRLPQHGVHAASQCLLTRSGGWRGIVIAALRLADQLGPRATVVTVMCDTGM